MDSAAPPMKVIIVGAGIGGLACAIACRRQDLTVIVFERAPEILLVGEEIQAPPNATRVLHHLGVLEALRTRATEIESRTIRRWETGKLLGSREYGAHAYNKFGYPSMVVHRADYQKILLAEALKLGAEIRTGFGVESIDFDVTKVILEGGESVKGDVIVGADGRQQPEEGLLNHGYGLQFEAKSFKSPQNSFCKMQAVTIWAGPKKHGVFYPLRNGEEYNLVLLRPDNLPSGVRTADGDLEEMKQAFENWDNVITKITSCFKSVLKWKLYHLGELETWTRGHVALLGDSCYPSLPYQAQGAAMAVEDGAVLGDLIGRYSRLPIPQRLRHYITIPKLLQTYESIQKPRSSLNVQGAIRNREMYHLPDGDEQIARDLELEQMDWKSKSKWSWIDSNYQHLILGSDRIDASKEEFEELLKG